MATTLDEQQLSTLRYTYKDFNQAFSDIKDVFDNVTNSFNLDLTNNSDPLFVLSEQLALAIDKLSYNVDMNANEQFFPSLTQENSARKITDMNGYNMGYYKSATSQISFTYIGGIDEIDTELGLTEEEAQTGIVILKAFDTSFKTEENIVYTLLEDIVLTTDTLTVTEKLAMQGELSCLTINGTSATIEDPTLIQYYNLDEQNRLYFNDSLVAENGVFINKKYYSSTSINDSDVWRRVDNLKDAENGAKVYKFGYDSSSELPYIEFPDWAADILEGGIEVWYLITDGTLGAVDNNTLTALNGWGVTDGSGVEITVGSFDSSAYSIANGSSVGAKDKETINEAYSNLKKTLGTFNTLVSCRDYSNAIYEYEEDTTNNYLVSAVQVADVRTDPNVSIPVFSRFNGDISSYHMELLDTDIDKFVLYPHATLPVNANISTQTRFNSTFSLITQENLLNIETAIEDYKTMCHSFSLVPDNNFDMIIEKAPLRVNIATNTQVNETEQSTIVSNIKKELYKAFNARNVDFGEQLVYEDIYNTIKNADARITLVTFDDPILTPYVVTGDGTTTEFAPTRYGSDPDDPNAHSMDIDIIVNNILAGRISLYGKNSSFSYDYGMDLSTIEKNDGLAFIKATSYLDLEKDQEVTVPKNEVIQVVEDSYLTTLTYPAYVYYSFYSETHIDAESAIPADSVYKLGEDEILYIYYTDSEDVKQFIEYKEGSIVKVSFDLHKTTDNAESGSGVNGTASRFGDFNKKKLVDSGDSGAINLYALDTEETIDILEKNELTFNTSNQNCFWYIKPRVLDLGNGEYQIDNESGDLIFKKINGHYIHILENGEYFIYPNSNSTTLYYAATGTKLEWEVEDEEPEGAEIRLAKLNVNEYIDQEELEEAIVTADVGIFEKSFRWECVNFKYSPLILTETAMTTFVEDEIVKYTNDSDAGETSLNLINEWGSLSEGTNLNGDYEGDKTNFYVSGVTNVVARVITIINGNNLSEQTVEENQTISYATEDDLKKETTDTFVGKVMEVGKHFQIYEPQNAYGDLVLRTSQFKQEGDRLQISTGEFDYLYNMIIYDNIEAAESFASGSQLALFELVEDLNINSRDEYYITLDKLFGTYDSSTGAFSGGIVDDNNCITIYCNQPDLYISVFDNDTQITKLFKEEDTDEDEESSKIVLDFTYILEQLGPMQLNLYQVFISLPQQLAINPYLTEGLLDASEDEEKVNEIIQIIIDKLNKYPTFDYLGTLNSSKLIDSYDVLNSFFDYNNLYNPFTIEQLDFDNSEFTIVSSSRKVSK